MRLKRKIQVLLIWAIALCLSFMVLQSGISRHGNHSEIAKSVFGAPLVSSHLAKLKNDKPDELSFQKTAHLVLSSSPLNSNILFYVYVTSADKNDEILQQAKYLDGRNRAGIYSNINRLIKSHDYKPALDEMSLLFRMDGSKHDALMPILMALYNIPASRAHILDILSKNNNWSVRFVKFLIENNKDQFSTFDALKSVGSTLVNPHEIYSDYLKKLVAEGYVFQAYDYWKSFHGLQNSNLLEPYNLFFNSRFQDIKVSQPFDWVILGVGETYNSFISDGGVLISYPGKKKTRLVYQIVPSKLENGNSYNLTYQAYFARNHQSGNFNWTISCHDGGVLHSEPILSDKKKQTFSFFVEQDCKFLEVAIYGMPSFYPKRQDLTLSYASLFNEF